MGRTHSQDYCLLESIFWKTGFVLPHHIRLHFDYYIFLTLRKKSISLIFFSIIYKNITEFSRLIAENHKTTRTRNVFINVFQCDSQYFASFLKAIHGLIGQVRANCTLQKSEVTTEEKTSFYLYLQARKYR